MTDSQKLDNLLFETRLTNDMLATLIRSLTVKGVISNSDFSRSIAFGKHIDLNDLVFGMNKR